MSEGDWDTVMGVHLRGSFLMARAVQKHMVDAGWGRIVNLSSTSALGNRGQANYSAAKAGMQGFTKTLAIELGKFGVTANAIAPGFIQTDMTAATAERMKIPFDDFIKWNAEQIPVARVAQELGAPVILVNNAGVLRDNLLFKMSVSDWDTVMNVHLRGAFLMSRACQKHMVDAQWGRIVNLSSSSALGNRGQANYSAAKAGLQGFTKTVAHELGRFGVTCNAVAPGFIVTDMTKTTAERVGMGFEDFKAAAASQIPVQRVGEPDDIANAIAFFTGEAAGFVSGQVLYVAGGPRT
jgi:3-oxoacyl-[acyl-carrier protein] reductase